MDRSAWSDEAVLRDVRRNGATAYAEIYLRYAAPVRRFAARLVAPDDVDDLVAEVFMKMLRALRGGKGPVDNPIAYLLVAARTTAASMHTRRTRGEEVARRSANELVEERLPDLSDDQLVAAYRSLSSRWRQVIWWSEIEGRSPVEIGELLDITPAAASATAFRARRALRRAYLAAVQDPAD